MSGLPTVPLEVGGRTFQALDLDHPRVQGRITEEGNHATLIEQGVQAPLSVLGTEFMRSILNAMTGPMGGSADSVFLSSSSPRRMRPSGRK